MAVGDAEAETLMEAAERQILQIQYARSLREPPWDGETLLPPLSSASQDNAFHFSGAEAVLIYYCVVQDIVVLFRHARRTA